MIPDELKEKLKLAAPYVKCEDEFTQYIAGVALEYAFWHDEQRKVGKIDEPPICEGVLLTNMLSYLQDLYQFKPANIENLVVPCPTQEKLYINGELKY